MELIDAVISRHSVREYLDKEIEKEKVERLQTMIDKINAANDLSFQLVTNEPDAFNGNSHYGRFVGVKNYVALVGKKCKNLDEKIGYFGEHVVLFAQMLGLNTCWVALTYKKSAAKVQVKKDEKLVCVLALGYGKDQGVPHKSKDILKVSNVSSDTPDWFESGVKSALLAPTAINQQQFYFTYSEGEVKVKKGVGFYSKVDLGIVKYHFEIGSGVAIF